MMSSRVFRALPLVALGLLLVAALGVVVTRSGPLAPTRVTVVPVSEGRLTPGLFGIGAVEARRALLIGPTAPGRVRAVAVDVGDRVTAGQLLAEMEPVDLDERAVALAAASARARGVVVAAEAQHQDALARQALATANVQRQVALAAQQFVSASTVEGRVQEQRSAEATAQATAASMVVARQDMRRLDAEAAALRQQRAHVRLLAPANGVVVSREAEAGSTVVAGQAVLRLIDPASLWVKVRFDQGRSAGLTAGLPAHIVLRSRPSEALPGRVARVEAVSDSVAEERLALVRFDSLPAALSVGELAEVTLTLPATEPALLLPNSSVQRRDGQVGVWRMEAGQLQFMPVRLGQRSLDGLVQVLDGVKAGDHVVVHSEKALHAQSRVKVVSALSGEAP